MTKMTIGVTIDCENVASAAVFWRETLRYDEPNPLTADTQFHALVSPDGGLHHITLQKVPEAKSTKNRVHLDLFVDDLDHEVERLRRLGGSVVAEHDEDGGFRTTIMADPNSNEFCVVQRQGVMND